MIVGLTGGIGSGKSTVLHLFKELGHPCYIADTEAKRLMQEDAGLKSRIVSLLGEEAYHKGALNRTFIAQRVFTDKKLLQQLNAIVHPTVRTDFSLFVKQQGSNAVIIYEAAILFESGSDKNCDYIITVISDIKDRIDRLMARDGSSVEEIQNRMNQQLSDEEKIKKSAFVIRNNQLQDTKCQVRIISKILSKVVKI